MSEVNEGKVIKEHSKVKDIDLGFLFRKQKKLTPEEKKHFTREKQ